MEPVEATFGRSGGLRGEVHPPADKSIAHRAALLAAMGEGQTRITNYLEAEDTLSTLSAIEKLGAEVQRSKGERGLDLVITGIGIDGPARAAHGRGPVEIDCGNAGTLIRLISGWLAGQPGGEWILTGDESLRSRPMERIAGPLRSMGAMIETAGKGTAPIHITGSRLRGRHHDMAVASAQIKSCLILAGLLAEGESRISEPVLSRDHTETMLAASGAGIEVPEPGTVVVEPLEGALEVPDIEVPGDFSSAAFFAVGATVVRDSEVRLSRVGMNPTRTGLMDSMLRMGAKIELENEAEVGGEPVADLVVRSAPVIISVEIGRDRVPAMIDELPLISLLGVMGDGRTVVSGAEELRHKESDRIEAVVEGMWDLGAQIEETADGFVVQGNGDLWGGTISSRGDHRIAMLGAIAGQVSKMGVTVRGFESVAISYPGFAADLASLQVRADGSQ